MLISNINYKAISSNSNSKLKQTYLINKAQTLQKLQSLDKTQLKQSSLQSVSFASLKPFNYLSFTSAHMCKKRNQINDEDREYKFSKLLYKLEEVKSPDSFTENYLIPKYQNSYIKRKDNSKVKIRQNAIQFIKQEELKPKAALQFLYSLTQKPQEATKLAYDLTKDPFETIKNFKQLKNLIATNSKNLQLFNAWLNDEVQGYKSAYSRYYNQSWQKAQTLEEIVKISPNIAPWALETKANELDKEFILGALPQEFGTLEDFRELIKTIKTSEFYKLYKDSKDAMTDKATQLRIAKEHGISVDDSLAMSEITNGFLKNPAPIVSRNGCILYPIIESFSPKLIFRIETPSKEEYIMKLDPYRPDPDDMTDMARKIRENQDLRPDMPYLNAMIDFYIKLNDVSCAPDIRFYDHVTNAVIYKQTQGQMPDGPIPNQKNLYLLKENPQVKELSKFGIQLNDIHNGNFLKTQKGNLVLIDSGHSTYKDPLKPTVICKNISIGNLCGKERI